MHVTPPPLPLLLSLSSSLLSLSGSSLSGSSLSGSSTQMVSQEHLPADGHLIVHTWPSGHLSFGLTSGHPIMHVLRLYRTPVACWPGTESFSSVLISARHRSGRMKKGKSIEQIERVVKNWMGLQCSSNLIRKICSLQYCGAGLFESAVIRYFRVSCLLTSALLSSRNLMIGSCPFWHARCRGPYPN